jgi:hypothetical protein
MRYLGENERIQQMMGIGYLGEIRRGPDGNVYQFLQGMDGLGNPIGFWKILRRIARKVAPRIINTFIPPAVLKAVLPVVQQVASAIPLPQAQAIAAGLKYATPVLREVGVAGYDGLGALYQAPDGTLYQMRGMDATDDLRGFADQDLRGLEADELHGFADQDLRGLEADELHGFADQDLRGFAADELHGFADQDLRGLEADELHGFADQDLRGFAADDLHGFADQDLRGLEADELHGFAEQDLRGLQADDLHGFADQDLRGLDADEFRGYVSEQGVNGLEAYVPDRPAGTRWFVPPSQPPDMWRPLW